MSGSTSAALDDGSRRVVEPNVADLFGPARVRARSRTGTSAILVPATHGFRLEGFIRGDAEVAGGFGASAHLNSYVRGHVGRRFGVEWRIPEIAAGR